MKAIGSVKENLSIENRISITPDTTKKLVDLKLVVFLEKNYGKHLGIKDEDYTKQGARLLSSVDEVFKKSDIILKANCPSKEEIDLIKNKSILITGGTGMIGKALTDSLLKDNANITIVSLDNFEIENNDIKIVKKDLREFSECLSVCV